MVDPVRAIADAVLYEGYILWPYRRSALKNQRRFTFGGVYPPDHTARHPDDPSMMRAEVLVLGDPHLEVTVRFLHVVQRTVLDADDQAVDERVVDGERFVTWEEAVERSISAPGPVAIPPGREREGFLVRAWEGLEGDVAIETERVDDRLRRVSVTVRNATPFPDGGARQDALKRTFCSTHMLLRATGGGGFVSITDPPAELAEAAARAAAGNVGCWPVLVDSPDGESVTSSPGGSVDSPDGESITSSPGGSVDSPDGESITSSPGGELAGDQYSDTMLASPIILEDHPRIAPESPGDLFDGGEIDQLLVLNILAMTDEEKAEMAASDARAREILERTEALTPDQLMALHGRTVLR